MSIDICCTSTCRMGNVQDRYIRYTSAGDQYVGRTVVGLSVDRAEFGTLPPDVVTKDRNKLNELLGIVFPNIPQRLRKVGKFWLASLVHHKEFLDGALPKHHPLRSTPLFTCWNQISAVAENVVCGLNLPLAYSYGHPTTCVASLGY